MNRLKDERGYALIIVLLMIVLFLSAAVTFMAGSLNHANQEVTVDTGNQAVAAAEMGTIYYSEDFERELRLVEQNIKGEAERLIDCIGTSKAGCEKVDNEKNKEKFINDQLREMYFESLIQKVKTYKYNSIDENLVKYTVDLATIKQFEGTTILDSAVLNNTPHPQMQSSLDSIDVVLNIKGKIKDVEKQLEVTFNVDIPKSFVSASSNSMPENNDDELSAMYNQVFGLPPDLPTCKKLIAGLKNEASERSYKCIASNESDIENILEEIKNNSYNPENFYVYTNNYICSKCNKIDHYGINLVLLDTDFEVSQNSNNIKNVNMIIDGKFSTKNANNFGKKGDKQRIVMKELNINQNAKNMEDTTLVILGFEEIKDNPKTGTAELIFSKPIDLEDNSTICLNVDQIRKGDLIDFATKVSIKNNGKLIYYTAFPKKYDAPFDGVKNNQIIPKYDYNEFLNDCGLSINPFLNVQPINSDYELEVEY
ncbi:hypothetical protein M1Q06_07225 [Planococcus sp. 11815]|uniref:hypothetical protein n=1 Tax=Planococcus sp. 11815 TaxID=2939413 RepID=UPI003DA6183B